MAGKNGGATGVKLRDIKVELRALGCRYIRAVGTHELWSTPNGFRFKVPGQQMRRGGDVFQADLLLIRQALRKGKLAPLKTGRPSEQKKKKARVKPHLEFATRRDLLAHIIANGGKLEC